MNILDRDSVMTGLQGLDAVIHVAGSVNFLAGRRRLVWDVNVLGSAHIYDAVLRLGIPRLIDTSSISALGPSPDGSLIDESTANPYQHENPIMFTNAKDALDAVASSLQGDHSFLRSSRLTYFDAKLAATELSRTMANDEGLPVVRVFPGTAVGPGDIHYAISQLVDTVWEGKLRMTYPGSTAFMDSRDFARGVVQALHLGKIGEEYILAGRPEDNLSYSDFMIKIAAVARECGSTTASSKAPLIPPPFLAYTASRVLEQLAPRAGLSYGMSLSACLNHRFTSGKAIRELGYSPNTSLQESIKACRDFSQRSHTYH